MLSQQQVARLKQQFLVGRDGSDDVQHQQWPDRSDAAVGLRSGARSLDVADERRFSQVFSAEHETGKGLGQGPGPRGVGGVAWKERDVQVLPCSSWQPGSRSVACGACTVC
jgi:hypothetical protein